MHAGVSWAWTERMMNSNFFGNATGEVNQELSAESCLDSSMSRT